tara:strand:- start:36431 stop:37009 length:579 start_codon:yes stop_codon:yes gene_type:complete
MRQSFPRNSAFTLLLIALFVSACGSAPTLLSKSANVPDGVDFSGQWHIRQQDGGRRPAASAEDREEFVLPSRQRPTRNSRRGSDRSVQVFLEFGESLKITQTEFGIFISYDRSVVEEFTFGENRVVTIGPIEALRASGWEGDRFVVETLDDAGSLMRETWAYGDNADVLVRDIRISKGDTQIYSRQQVFERS